MKLKTLLPIYFAVLAADCAAVLTENNTLQLFMKPLLMPVLIFYFVAGSKKRPPVKNLLTAALFFSWVGDVVLLLDKTYGNLFVFGLLAFLIAHIFYIFFFRKIAGLNGQASALRIFAVAGVLAYSGVVYALLFPYLGLMKIPVLIYSIIISLMLAAGFHAFKSFAEMPARLCIAGIMIFALSDSMLAVNRFAMPFAAAPVLIMLTYGIAQLLITEGSLRQLTVINKQ